MYSVVYIKSGGGIRPFEATATGPADHGCQVLIPALRMFRGER